MTGDGKLNLVSFADDRVFIAFNNGDGTFQSAHKVLNAFCRKLEGWIIEKYPRFIADLMGNDSGDIIGFGETGVHVTINNSNGTFEGGLYNATAFPSGL
jgi:hypothetical protein